MIRYINADILYEKANEIIKIAKNEHQSRVVDFMKHAIIPMIVLQPTVDVAPVIHAKWKDNGANYKCSNCGNTEAYDDMLYCPKCGAKMNEE